MKNIFFINEWALRPRPDSLQTRSAPILKLLFWFGLIFCLGIIFLSQAPPFVRAIGPGAAPPVPNLSLTITDNPDPVKLGTMLTYTITITNDGTADATNTVVTSDLDSHVQFVSTSPGCSHDGVHPNGVVTCNLGVMSPGETISLSITVTVVSSPDDQLVANTTTVTSDNGAIDCDAVTTTVIAPKVGIIKTDQPDPVAVGDILTYTLVISNSGYAEATGVVLSDTLDPDVSFRSANPPPTSHNGLVVWNIGTLAPGQTITHTLSVTVSKTATGPLNNVACVAFNEGADVCDDEPTDVLTPELKVEKFDQPDPVGLGQVLTYTIQVMNTGGAQATGVVISDDLPAAVFFRSASNGGTHNGVNPNGVVTWPVVPVLLPGQTITRTVSVTVSNNLACDARFTNIARATALEGVQDEATAETGIGGGTIQVLACEDKDANGQCGPNTAALPAGIQACLADSGGQQIGECKNVPATFPVGGGDFMVSLKFTGPSQGLYPTRPPQPVQVSACGTISVTLPAVVPIHPKGVAVHEESNKVYVPFQGPQVGNNWPYPFVAVIDSETDMVLKTIPGDNAVSPGIGDRPWSVVAAPDFVYVGSFDDRWVSVIDPATDSVVKNIGVGGIVPANFRPAASTRNPHDPNKVHFADYGGGGVLIIDGMTASSYKFISDPPGSKTVFSPFEIVVAEKDSSGRNFVTMRDAIQTEFEIRGFNTPPPDPSISQHDLPVKGSPHAIGLWQNHPSGKPRLFVSYADDPPPTPNVQGFKNPNRLLVYEYDPSTDALNLMLDDKTFFEYAEAGLIYNPVLDQMLGAYGGFAYWDGCQDDKPIRGGTFTIDSVDNAAAGPKPNRVVSNPSITASNLDWKNPFELAHNPRNDKIYVTDRCWNDWATYGGLSRPGHGAVLVISADLVAAAGENEDQAVTLEDETPDTPGAFNKADLNQDGQVDLLDLSIVASRYGSNDPTADVNQDGLVDILDMNIVASSYGQ